MPSITSAADLKNAIRQLEAKQAIEFELMKEEFKGTYENLKLINIIKNTFKEAAKASDLKTDIMNTAIGLSTGIVAKKLLLGKTLNPFSKLFGIIIELAVANMATKNATGIKTIGSMIIKKIFNKQGDPVKT